MNSMLLGGGAYKLKENCKIKTQRINFRQMGRHERFILPNDLITPVKFGFYHCDKQKTNFLYFDIFLNGTYLTQLRANFMNYISGDWWYGDGNNYLGCVTSTEIHNKGEILVSPRNFINCSIEFYYYYNPYYEEIPI